MSHVERKSKYTKLAKLPNKSADSVAQACARVLLPLADRIETITYDNGKEFASHAEIATSLGAQSYFAKPYHSWERGLNEHTNGLFRHTSQKVQTSLFCPMPMSKASRTNSTPAPERYSATKTHARFSSSPKTGQLHFTVEWAWFNPIVSAIAYITAGLADGAQRIWLTGRRQPWPRSSLRRPVCCRSAPRAHV